MRIEEDSFDPHASGNEKKTSVLGATINMFKALVGIGVLALPSAFNSSGWLGGLIVLPLCAIAMLYFSLELIKVADLR